MSSSKSLFGGLNFSAQRSFTCLVRFIPVWLLSYCEWGCLTDFFHCFYRGKTHFCVLVLHPNNLLKAFINLKRFLVPSLGLMYKIITSISVIIDFMLFCL